MRKVYRGLGRLLYGKRNVFRYKSIIQGLGVGPVLYIIFASDLRTLSKINVLSKYADDTSLISPQFSDVDIVTEFNNLLEWARFNKLHINKVKR